MADPKQKLIDQQQKREALLEALRKEQAELARKKAEQTTTQTGSPAQTGPQLQNK